MPFDEAKLSTTNTPKVWRQLFRAKIPDKFKRKAILTYLDFDGSTADKNYLCAKEIAGADFIETTGASLLTVKKCGSLADILTDAGKREVEFILMHLNKQMGLETSPGLIHLSVALLVMLRPSEVFFVVEKLARSSRETVKKGEVGKMRWHVGYGPASVKMIAVAEYLFGEKYGEIGVAIAKCSFKSFMSDFLSLQELLNLTLIFLCEGVKALLRYTLVVWKLNQATFSDLESLKVESKKQFFH